MNLLLLQSMKKFNVTILIRHSYILLHFQQQKRKMLFCHLPFTFIAYSIFLSLFLLISSRQIINIISIIRFQTLPVATDPVLHPRRVKSVPEPLLLLKFGVFLSSARRTVTLPPSMVSPVAGIVIDSHQPEVLRSKISTAKCPFICPNSFKIFNIAFSSFLSSLDVLYFK